MAHFVAPVAVKTEAFAPHPHIFRVFSDDFDQALEPAEERQAGSVQADQQLAVRETLEPVTYHHRHIASLGLMATAMRDEGDRRIVPQQPVERFSNSLVRSMQQHAHPVLHGLVAQLAGGAQLVFAAGVEINFRHGGNAVSERLRDYSKAIRQNSLTNQRYSVADEGNSEVCKERIKISDRYRGMRTSAGK